MGECNMFGCLRVVKQKQIGFEIANNLFDEMALPKNRVISQGF